VPAALRRLARASREAAEALDALLRPRVAARLIRTPVGWRLGLAALEGLLPGAVKAALRLVLVETPGLEPRGQGLRAAHLRMLAALLPAGPGARVRLPGGLVVERGRDALWLLPPAHLGGPVPLAVPGQAHVGELVGVTAAIGPAGASGPDGSDWEAWFDAGTLGLDPPAGAPPEPVLEIRPRRAGERMVPYGAGQAVRLSKLLATAGVPRYARSRWPVVARREEILWLMGVRRGAAAPLTVGTRSVLRLRAAPIGPLV
jgi:tRNA(Ile)-lysidine synthetase-like protein